jgi:hypothetical protein
MLLEQLRRHDFTALWAYHDASVDAAGSLNLLAPPAIDLPVVALQFLRHLRRNELGVALHYLRSTIHHYGQGAIAYAAAQIVTILRGMIMRCVRARRLTGAELVRTGRNLRKTLVQAFGSGASALQAPYTRAELLDMAAVVYPERAVPLNQADEDELLLFTTAESLHTRDIYTPAALRRLLDERGLHLGHCYLLNQIPYIAGVFQHGGRTARLTKEWTEFIDAMSEHVGSRRLWNPNAAELAEWMRGIQHVDCQPVGAQSLRLRNLLSRSIGELTLLLPRQIAPDSVRWSGAKPDGWRYWGDWLAVWGDLPAGADVTVCWGACASNA